MVDCRRYEGLCSAVVVPIAPIEHQKWRDKAMTIDLMNKAIDAICADALHHPTECADGRTFLQCEM